MEAFLAGVLTHIVPILITIIGAILLKIIQGVGKKYGGKLDVETQQRAEELLSGFVQQGVAQAEQWAKNEAKRQGSVGGSAKMNRALEFVAAEARRNGLPALAESILTSKIEAALGFGTLNENHGDPGVIVGSPMEVDDEEDSEFICD